MTNKGTSGGKRQKGFFLARIFRRKKQKQLKRQIWFLPISFPAAIFWKAVLRRKKIAVFFCKSLSVSRVNVVVVAAAAIVVAGVVVVVVRVAEKIAKGRPEKSFNVLTK